MLTPDGKRQESKIYGETFYIPEYQEDNPSFYLQNGKKISQLTTPIKGFKIYVFTEALGNFSAPFTIQAVPSSEQHITTFVSVSFKVRPDFEKYGLSVMNQDGKQIVYMDSSELVKHPDAIFLDGGDWLQNGLKYHAIGALHDLGIIHTLSQSLFLNPYCLESNEKDLYVQYGLNGSFNVTLGRLFTDTYFALEFFGFSQTDDEKLLRALKNASLIAQQAKTCDFGCTFDFGALRFAIARYHEAGFPHRMVDPRILTPDTHRELLDIVHHVASMFKMLGYIIEDDEFKSSLTRNLELFKKENSIKENYCGRKTIRVLLSATCNFDHKRLEIAAGIQGNDENPRLEIEADPRFIGIPAVTDMIDTIPNMQQIVTKMSQEITRSTSSTRSSCERLNERLVQCDKSLNSIKVTLDAVSSLSSIIDEKLEKAGNSLEEVMEAHANVEEQIMALSKKINTEFRGNVLFMLIPAIIVILVIKKLILSISYI